MGLGLDPNPKLIRGLAGGATLPALEAALDHMSAAAERLGEAASSTADWCVLSEEVERRARAARARATMTTPEDPEGKVGGINCDCGKILRVPHVVPRKDSGLHPPGRRTDT